jgi:hypothetical protein
MNMIKIIYFCRFYENIYKLKDLCLNRYTLLKDDQNNKKLQIEFLILGLGYIYFNKNRNNDVIIKYKNIINIFISDESRSGLLCNFINMEQFMTRSRFYFTNDELNKIKIINIKDLLSINIDLEILFLLKQLMNKHMIDVIIDYIILLNKFTKFPNISDLDDYVVCNIL